MPTCTSSDKALLLHFLEQTRTFEKGLKSALPLPDLIENAHELTTFYEASIHDISDKSFFRSIKELAFHRFSLLQFLEQNDLPLDKNIASLLMQCTQLILSDLSAYSKGTLLNNYDVQRDAVLSQFSEYVFKKMDFDLLHCEDVFISDDDAATELAYLTSIVDKKKNPKKPQPHSLPKSNKFSASMIPSQNNAAQQSTRVKSYLLEQLMSHSEELVQIRNALADLAEKENNQRLSEISNKLMSISENILNDLLKTRMRPIGTLLKKYKRIVRDLSQELNKKVDLDILGENIELDSNVLDAISEPLTHLVRNAIDHGFEFPDQRASAGKSMVGHLLIHAYNASGKVVISISDDGKGIDEEQVLLKAISRGLILPEEAKTLNKKQILNLIFNAGLSTSKQVTAVSGRGVGMDAVKRKVEEIKGRIEISSQWGKGTQIELIFPLTMATLKVALFKINDVNYAIPSGDISQIIGLSRQDKSSKVRFDGEQATLYRNDKIVPLIDPCLFLNHLPKESSIKSSYMNDTLKNIVIFHCMEREWGLVVDDVFAFMDIVIKPMENSMDPAQIFSGITVLGNGDLALVMNLKQIVQYLQGHL